ncbi:MAG: DUF4097 family beta strand repeat-containing protein [Candidatus Pelethousia sp.]|nr:DUF4097 family beta strand repeat-containing protein [Candidatus Pelethousia sp.]
MKTSVIIRIICWAVIAIVLLGVLVWGIAGNAFGFQLLPFSFLRRNVLTSSHLEGKLGTYSSTNAYTLDPSSIKNIDISWVAGSVTVKPYDGDTISFTENCLAGIPEKYALQYGFSDDTLTIHYWGGTMDWVPRWQNFSKSLEVLVPKTLDGDLSLLSVDSVSANINISGLTGERMQFETISGSADITGTAAQDLSFDTTSGSMRASACTAATLQADSTSGSINLEGAFNEIRTDTVSGSVKISSTICPEIVQMDSVSGESTLIIPENKGFTARYESVSGNFSCDFPATVSIHTATYGDGSASFRFDSVSGEIYINKIG